MTKLIKPVMIDNIIRSGVVLKSRKAYKEMCKLCFLNANNYLNVLKYIKHNKNKFPLKSTL